MSQREGRLVKKANLLQEKNLFFGFPDKIVPNDQMIFSKNNLKIVQSRVV